jgi:hypothetical protein
MRRRRDIWREPTDEEVIRAIRSVPRHYATSTYVANCACCTYPSGCACTINTNIELTLTGLTGPSGACATATTTGCYTNFLSVFPIGSSIPLVYAAPYGTWLDGNTYGVGWYGSLSASVFNSPYCTPEYPSGGLGAPADVLFQAVCTGISSPIVGITESGGTATITLPSGTDVTPWLGSEFFIIGTSHSPYNNPYAGGGGGYYTVTGGNIGPPPTITFSTSVTGSSSGGTLMTFQDWTLNINGWIPSIGSGFGSTDSGPGTTSTCNPFLVIIDGFGSGNGVTALCACGPCLAAWKLTV